MNTPSQKAVSQIGELIRVTKTPATVASLKRIRMRIVIPVGQVHAVLTQKTK